MIGKVARAGPSQLNTTVHVRECFDCSLLLRRSYLLLLLLLLFLCVAAGLFPFIHPIQPTSHPSIHPSNSVRSFVHSRASLVGRVCSFILSQRIRPVIHWTKSGRRKNNSIRDEIAYEGKKWFHS